MLAGGAATPVAVGFHDGEAEAEGAEASGSGFAGSGFDSSLHPASAVESANAPAAARAARPKPAGPGTGVGAGAPQNGHRASPLRTWR